MELVVITTVVVTLLIVVTYYVSTSESPLETIPMGPDGTRFYSSISPRNRVLRPMNRAYYLPDDSRIPLPIRNRIQEAFQRALRDFPLRFPVTTPRLLFASGDTEGGMPHTLDQYVIVPIRDSLRSDSPKSLWTTMIHELCHVHQRQDPAAWAGLYTRLGFQKVYDRDVTDVLSGDSVVANPDAGLPGMSQIGWWSYRDQVGVLVFTASPTTIRDHKSVVYPVSPSGITDGKNRLKETFGDLCSQYDHPNEITACLIADHWDSIVRPPPRAFGEDDPRAVVRRWLKERSK